GGGLEGQLGAGAEAGGGGDGVLHLDALVGEQARVGEDLLDIAQQPQGQIHQVDALVHQGAAAVELPGAAPGAGVVVLLAAPQRHLDGGGGDRAEPPLADQLLEVLVLGGEAALAGDGQQLPGGLLGGADPVGGLDGDLDRLLEVDVLASLQRLDGDVRVQPGGHGDDGGLDVLPGQQLGDGGRGLDVVLGGHL